MKLRYMIIKDVKKILYDKKLLAIIVAMPIILMTILGFSLNNMFGSSGGSLGGIKVAVVKNYDAEEDLIRFQNTLQSGFLANGMDNETKATVLNAAKEYNPEKIFFEFLEADEIKKMMNFTIQDEEQAKEMLMAKKVNAVIILPEGYVYNTYMNYALPVRNIVEIEVVKHSDNTVKGSIVEGLVNGFMQTMNNYSLDKEVFMNKVTEESNMESALMGISYLMEELTKNIEESHSTIENIGVEKKKNITSFQYYAAAIMAMFILYSASTGGKFLLEEKKDITLQRNRVAGVSLGKIMISNFFMMCIIALLQSSIMIIFSNLVLNINWGDLRLVILTVLISSFAVGGIGMFISIVTIAVGNYKFANIFEFGVIQFMALIGGSFVPVEVLPKVIQKLSFFSLNGVAIKMYTANMRGVGLADMWNYVAILVGMGALFIAIAAIIARIRKEAI